MLLPSPIIREMEAFMFYDEKKVEEHLQTRYVGRFLLLRDEISSTNRFLKENFAHLPHGAAVVSASQTCGRGSKGRKWESPKGSSIALSVLFHPQKPFPYQILTLCAGVCTCRAIEDVTGLSPQIKWPNDVVVGGKKLCGILCESVFAGKYPALIVGIGINVSSTQYDFQRMGLPYATSLGLELGHDVEQEPIIARLLYWLEQAYDQLSSHGDLGPWQQEIQKRCVTLQKQVRVETATGSYPAFAKDIAEDGSLLVDTSRGEEKLLVSEVSVRGMYGYSE